MVTSLWWDVSVSEAWVWSLGLGSWGKILFLLLLLLLLFYVWFQLLLKHYLVLLSTDFTHSKLFSSARSYWTLTKYPVIFNQPTDRMNYCISTSNFLRRYHFVTMTSSRGWRQRCSSSRISVSGSLNSF